MMNGIWLAVLGLLGASSLIIARKPDAKQLIAKIAPFQGWIGAASAFWGVWTIIWCVLNLSYLGHFLIPWTLTLADGVLQAALGLLLGVGVLKSFIKDQTANAKMDQTIAKLAPFQGTLGLIALFLGLGVIAISVVMPFA